MSYFSFEVANETERWIMCKEASSWDEEKISEKLGRLVEVALIYSKLTREEFLSQYKIMALPISEESYNTFIETWGSGNCIREVMNNGVIEIEVISIGPTIEVIPGYEE